MIPFGWTPLMFRGPVLYAEFWLRLSRALAAPWLYPWQRGAPVPGDAEVPEPDRSPEPTPPAPDRLPPRLRVVSRRP